MAVLFCIVDEYLISFIPEKRPHIMECVHIRTEKVFPFYRYIYFHFFLQWARRTMK